MAIATPETFLSARDARILNALFDPETLPSSVSRSQDSTIINASLPAHPTIPSAQFQQLENAQNSLVRQITASSSLSDIENALSQEDEIVRSCPDYPSAYTNRAMLLRMKIEATLSKDQTLFESPVERIGDLFSDLSRAIHLSLPTSSSSAQVSTFQARILRIAFSHRAYLYLKASETLEMDLELTGVELKGKGRSELEELASIDFAAAARYGDEVAREMSVRTNPYAKMCGAIVRNALMEERKDAGML